MATRPKNTEDEEDVVEEVQWDETRPAYVQMPEWLLFHPDVSDGAKLTWQALASYADKQGTAFPGVKKVGKQRNRGRSVMFGHIRELENAGALRRKARYRQSDGGRTSTLYTLAWAKPFVTTPDRPPEPDNPAVENAATDPTPPVRKSGRGRAEKRTGPRAEIRATRTKPSYEQTPVVPSSENVTVNDHALDVTTSQPKGATPPSDTPNASFNQHRGRKPRLTPRQLGTNPRALAATAAADADGQSRLERARSYGARMASLAPLPWTVDEFVEVSRHEFANDPASADTAFAAYAEVAQAADTVDAD
jgi:hypothetical protein